jgi:hypothetical protein
MIGQAARAVVAVQQLFNQVEHSIPMWQITGLS